MWPDIPQGCIKNTWIQTDKTFKKKKIILILQKMVRRRKNTVWYEINLEHTCKTVIWLGAKIKSKQMGSNHPSVPEGVVLWIESQELML